MVGARQVVLVIAVLAVFAGVASMVARIVWSDNERSQIVRQIRMAVKRVSARHSVFAASAKKVAVAPAQAQVGAALGAAPSPGVSTPFAERYSARLNCTGVDTLARVKHFLAGSEWTGCAEDSWLQLMHAVSPSVADKVFVNVGCWKGYEVLQWLEVWAPHYMAHKRFNRSSWVAALPPGCGYCGQCRESERIPYNSWSSLAAASGSKVSAPRIYAYEPLVAMQPVLQKLSATLGLSDAVVFSGEAFGAQVGKGEFPNCTAEREDCGLDTALGVERIPVAVTTIDAEFDKHKWGHIDILSIDTEGNDFPVLIGGAKKVLSQQLVDVLSFEYHAVGAWAKESLGKMVAQLDEWRYDCWFAGKSGTWRITGCWDERLEFKANSRVWCALRTGKHRWIFDVLRSPFPKVKTN